VVTKATVREVVGREAVMDCVCTVQGRLVLESEARVLIPRRPGTKPPDAADPTASKAASA
jgi:hypothetical protein